MGNPYSNDNTTYSSLGFQALLILNRLRTKLELSELAEQQKEDGERNAERSGADEQRAEDDSADVDQRLNKGTGICASQVWPDDPGRNGVRQTNCSHWMPRIFQRK